MAVDNTTLRIVWGETADLAPKAGEEGKALLQAIVGTLADAAAKRGSTANFTQVRSLPPVGTPAGDEAAAMATLVEQAIATGSYGGTPLPQRAAIWEVTAAGEPRDPKSIPPGADWILDTGAVTRTTDYRATGQQKAGRIFRLYETSAEPKVGDAYFISDFTGSGVAKPEAKLSAFSLPWFLGILAAVLFFWMLLSLAWTGHSVSQARSVMAGSLPTLSESYLATLSKACETASAVCEEQLKDSGKFATEVQACVAKPAAGAEPLMRTSSFCHLAWFTAFTTANSGAFTEYPGWLAPILSRVIGWPASLPSRNGMLSLAFPMAGMMLSFALLGVALGLGTKGRVFGIWVSPENRMSLARMQVTLWTVVVLGAYAAIALFNSGMLADEIRVSLMVSGGTQASALEAFPYIPAAILAALGIAFGSPMLSAVIKGDAGRTSVELAENSSTTDDSGNRRFRDRMLANPENLERRPSAADASLADLFYGEGIEDKDQIDVSRLQNVLITFILVGAYGTLLFELVRDISPEAIVAALNEQRSLLPSLPDVNAIFTGLLAASHAIYLVTKGASK